MPAIPFDLDNLDRAFAVVIRNRIREHVKAENARRPLRRMGRECPPSVRRAASDVNGWTVEGGR